MVEVDKSVAAGAVKAAYEEARQDEEVEQALTNAGLAILTKALAGWSLCASVWMLASAGSMPVDPGDNVLYLLLVFLLTSAVNAFMFVRVDGARMKAHRTMAAATAVSTYLYGFEEGHEAGTQNLSGALLQAQETLRAQTLASATHPTEWN